eukprot:CAMPEP_0172742954 /NCGR_PEP_ID=MMETSP1074-20121228/130872_1 /TAXON_ID=2916 /ORGANISM="Ceratium fusus, Strain PA161109" /LENGTH=114 /DNA_ID=CAMNT_0013573593 /DNA_START=663 /DNA_END=1007 /DNA_ORIENTATION=+
MFSIVTTAGMVAKRSNISSAFDCNVSVSLSATEPNSQLSATQLTMNIDRKSNPPASRKMTVQSIWHAEEGGADAPSVIKGVRCSSISTSPTTSGRPRKSIVRCGLMIAAKVIIQ